MSLVFIETLRGSYFAVDRPDAPQVCEVAVRVQMPRPRGVVRQLEATLSGTATLHGLATAQPIAGRLRVSLARPRQVAYTFTFASDDGREMTFAGAKHPSLMRPVFAATTLWGTLSHGGVPWGMMRLQFDLRRDLVAFLQSVRRPRD